jgi:serine protease Do
VDGQEVETTAELQQRIAFRKPGDTVELGIYRDGQRREVDVQLARRPETPEQSEPARTAMTTNKLGMEVRDLTPADAQALGFEEGGGVVVTQVRPFSPAWDTFPAAGRVPVVITEIDGKPVRNVQDYQAIVDDLEPGDTVYVKRKIAIRGEVQETYQTLKVPDEE